MKAKFYPGLFAEYPNRKSRAWLQGVSEEDRHIFGKVGLQHACEATDYQLWRNGGRANAKTACRDSKGRFTAKGAKP